MGKQSKKAKITKDTRIIDEKQRLNKIYDDIPEETKSIIDGLINRAAFMRVTLEDYEEDICVNGSVEKFTQSDKLEPYERGRPVVGFYNTMNKNYQSIIKQLTDLVPKQELKQTKDEGDGFEEFVESRD